MKKITKVQHKRLFVYALTFPVHLKTKTDRVIIIISIQFLSFCLFSV